MGCCTSAAKGDEPATKGREAWSTRRQNSGHFIGEGVGMRRDRKRSLAASSSDGETASERTGDDNQGGAVLLEKGSSRKLLLGHDDAEKATKNASGSKKNVSGRLSVKTEEDDAEEAEKDKRFGLTKQMTLVMTTPDQETHVIQRFVTRKSSVFNHPPLPNADLLDSLRDEAQDDRSDSAEVSVPVRDRIRIITEKDKEMARVFQAFCKAWLTRKALIEQEIDMTDTNPFVKVPGNDNPNTVPTFLTPVNTKVHLQAQQPHRPLISPPGSPRVSLVAAAHRRSTTHKRRPSRASFNAAHQNNTTLLKAMHTFHGSGFLKDASDPRTLIPLSPRSAATFRSLPKTIE